MTASPARTATPPTGTDQPAVPEKRHNLTPSELQRKQLERLLQRVDKPVELPEPPKEKELKLPKDLVRNVQGSSAGAGSGEFHVYRAGRRREYARMKIMDEKARQELELKQYQEKLDQMKQQDEERTARKRAKRQKRKSKGSNKKAKANEGDAATNQADGSSDDDDE